MFHEVKTDTLEINAKVKILPTCGKKYKCTDSRSSVDVRKGKLEENQAYIHHIQTMRTKDKRKCLEIFSKTKDILHTEEPCERQISHQKSWGTETIEAQREELSTQNSISSKIISHQ